MKDRVWLCYFMEYPNDHISLSLLVKSKNYNLMNLNFTIMLSYC